MLAETWSETDGYGIERMTSQAGLKRRYSYDGGKTWRHNARLARKAAGVPEPWYWLDGVPYCPACVEADSPCLGDDEAARANRSPAAQWDCRCACCGGKS
jgi:hypothetical protein